MARPKTPARTAPPSPEKRPRGRPPRAAPPGVVTGFRLPPELLERLDARVETLNARAPDGYKTNRNALVASLLRDGLDRAETRDQGEGP